MPKKFEEYVVGEYNDEKKDEFGKIILIRKRFRVSVIRSEASQSKRIIQDGFETEAEANAYADNRRATKNKR